MNSHQTLALLRWESSEENDQEYTRQNFLFLKEKWKMKNYRKKIIIFHEGGGKIKQSFPLQNILLELHTIPKWLRIGHERNNKQKFFSFLCYFFHFPDSCYTHLQTIRSLIRGGSRRGEWKSRLSVCNHLLHFTANWIARFHRFS